MNDNEPQVLQLAPEAALTAIADRALSVLAGRGTRFLEVPEPVLAYLRDTQRYVQAAAHGLARAEHGADDVDDDENQEPLEKTIHYSP